MTLLFDANLAPDLVRRLADVFPGSAHVFDCDGLVQDDMRIWEFSIANGYTIVSKDSDFHRMSFVLGAPPKVIWVRIGNGPTELVERVLRDHIDDIAGFDADPVAAFLALGRRP